MSCESALCAILALSAYFVLACMPLAVRWRWGLPVSLLYAVATAALLFVSAKYVIDRWIVPPVPEPSPCGDEGRGLGEAMLFFFLPGAATLAGAGLAVLWSTFAACRRYVRRARE